MRPTAIDCMARGLYSLRANWQLPLLLLLDNVLVALFLVVGVILPVALVEPSILRSLGERTDPAVWETLGRQLGEKLAAFSPAVLGALVAMFALWTAGFFVFCWFQAGLFGVLVAADRQAPPGSPRGWRWFRTFSLRDFAGWGGRYLWRFFWFVNFYLLVLLVVLLLVVLLLVLASYGTVRWGETAGVGIGCGGALPIVFVLLVTVFWYLTAQADLAREGSGVFRASRIGLEALGRRPGAVLAIAAVGFFLALAAATVFAVVSFIVERQVPGAAALAGLGINLVQALVNGVLTTFLSAAFVALVRSTGREVEAVER